METYGVVLHFGFARGQSEDIGYEADEKLTSKDRRLCEIVHKSDHDLGPESSKSQLKRRLLSSDGGDLGVVRKESLGDSSRKKMKEAFDNLEREDEVAINQLGEADDHFSKSV